MRILYVTTVGGTMSFFTEHIRQLQAQGHTVELCCQMERPLSQKVQALGCTVHPLPFSRTPLSLGNLKACSALKRLLEEERFDLVHTHTPNASVCVRFAARRLRKTGLRVLYTAHGFHFYKGAPLKNWLLFYPMEWLCAHWTDALITINQEDYALARTRLAAGQVYYVHGVGVELERFAPNPADRGAVRQSLGIPQEACLCLSVGELNRNKNHVVVLRALALLRDPEIHYCIAGVGSLEGYLRQEAIRLGLEQQVHILGYRADVERLYAAADIYCHPSIREGLSLAVIEAMSTGLPCMVSKIRGPSELIELGKGGYLPAPGDVEGAASAIAALAADAALRQTMGAHNRQAVKPYSMAFSLAELMEIYKRNLKRGTE